MRPRRQDHRPQALATLVTQAAETAAILAIIVHRDRLGVPERLSETLATLLILYAAIHSRDAPAA